MKIVRKYYLTGIDFLGEQLDDIEITEEEFISITKNKPLPIHPGNVNRRDFIIDGDIYAYVQWEKED